MKATVDWRLTPVPSFPHRGLAGAFTVIGPNNSFLRIISSGPPVAAIHKDWEHVSVSLIDRCPTWEEMCFVKDLFWNDDELVVQFHPPKSDYINCHPFVLHLWKGPQRIKLPPKEFV